MGAQFLKRFYIYSRNRKGLITEILVPVLLCIIGFGFSYIQFFRDQPTRVFTPDVYPVKQRILSNQILLSPSANTS